MGAFELPDFSTTVHTRSAPFDPHYQYNECVDEYKTNDTHSSYSYDEAKVIDEPMQTRSSTWICPSCSFLNAGIGIHCELCSSERPSEKCKDDEPATSSGSHSVSQQEEQEQMMDFDFNIHDIMNDILSTDKVIKQQEEESEEEEEDVVDENASFNDLLFGDSPIPISDLQSKRYDDDDLLYDYD